MIFVLSISFFVRLDCKSSDLPSLQMETSLQILSAILYPVHRHSLPCSCRMPHTAPPDLCAISFTATAHPGLGLIPLLGPPSWFSFGFFASAPAYFWISSSCVARHIQIAAFGILNLDVILALVLSTSIFSMPRINTETVIFMHHIISRYSVQEKLWICSPS